VTVSAGPGSLVGQGPARVRRPRAGGGQGRPSPSQQVSAWQAARLSIRSARRLGHCFLSCPCPSRSGNWKLERRWKAILLLLAAADWAGQSRVTESTDAENHVTGEFLGGINRSDALRDQILGDSALV
jgi:hypothetical protein